jgi:threo-3-hydroxy-L-aspartate ammonia-lyase
MQNNVTIPTYEDVVAASIRLAGTAHRTAVVTSRTVDREIGASVFFKCETFQRTGSFKFRGAYNVLAALPESIRARGVITFSSGNHAQALACAAHVLGVRCTVLMPSDAPLSKRNATAGYGATVVTYDRYRDDRESIVKRLAEQDDLTFLHPYDHADIIAGHGTAAAELLEDVGTLDALFVCVGGGGSLAGSVLAAKALAPACKVYGVEPEAGNDGQRSLRAGSIIRIDVPKTIADGAQTQYLGTAAFEVIRREVADILTVTDAELIACMRFFAERMKLIVEPTGCLSFAGLRSLPAGAAGGRIGVIVSGGNVDFSTFAQYVQT